MLASSARVRVVGAAGLPSGDHIGFQDPNRGQEIGERTDAEAALLVGQLRQRGQTGGLRVGGAKVGASGARISRLAGETAPDLALMMNVLDYFEVPEPEQKRLIALARQANEQTWWKISGMPARQAAFAELESTATSIPEYSMVFVPGLLQTTAYATVRYSDTEATCRSTLRPLSLAGDNGRRSSPARRSPSHTKSSSMSWCSAAQPLPKQSWQPRPST